MKKVGWLAMFLISLMVVCNVSAETIRTTINKRSVFQGDVLKVQLIRKSTAPFMVQFLDRKYSSVLAGKRQTVLIGIDYQLKPGKYNLAGSYEAVPNFYLPFQYVISVKQKFPKLKYKPPKRLETEQKIINQESGKTHTALQRQVFKLKQLKRFVWPIKPVKINAGFGERRCRDRDRRGRGFNCRYHLGTDYRAAFDKERSQPVAVNAINDGKVILLDNHLMDGKMLVIDHGNGISSGYLHLSKFLVREGDRVRAGQKIAIAGKTGATDAIHLHLFIKMDNGKTTVDPDKFLRMNSK